MNLLVRLNLKEGVKHLFADMFAKKGGCPPVRKGIKLCFNNDIITSMPPLNKYKTDYTARSSFSN